MPSVANCDVHRRSLFADRQNTDMGVDQSTYAWIDALNQAVLPPPQPQLVLPRAAPLELQKLGELRQNVYEQLLARLHDFDVASQLVRAAATTR